MLLLALGRGDEHFNAASTPAERIKEIIEKAFAAKEIENLCEYLLEAEDIKAYHPSIKNWLEEWNANSFSEITDPNLKISQLDINSLISSEFPSSPEALDETMIVSDDELRPAITATSPTPSDPGLPEGPPPLPKKDNSSHSSKAEKERRRVPQRLYLIGVGILSLSLALGAVVFPYQRIAEDESPAPSPGPPPRDDDDDADERVPEPPPQEEEPTLEELAREARDQTCQDEYCRENASRCLAHSLLSCLVIGDSLANIAGRASAEEASLSLYGKTRSIYRLVCEAGNPRGCIYYGEFLERGPEHFRDLPGATRAYVTACEDHVDQIGCYHRARRLDSASNTAEERARVRGWLDNACERDIGAACSDLARSYEQDGGTEAELARIDELYQRGCEGGVWASCFNRGRRYQEHQDPERARRLFHLALRHNFQPARFELEVLSLNARMTRAQFESAREYFDNECRSSNLRGCTQLGSLYDRGWGLNGPNRVLARHYYELACARSPSERERDPLACFNLGVLHQQGLGGPQNLELAHDLYDLACNAHHQASCEAAESLSDERRAR